MVIDETNLNIQIKYLKLKWNKKYTRNLMTFKRKFVKNQIVSSYDYHCNI